MATLRIFVFFIFMAMTNIVSGQSPAVYRLWDGNAPGALGNTDEDIPTITCYPAAPGIATGSAVVICPGGGYVYLAMDHEGKQVAEWFNSFGVTAYVLKYRIHTQSRAYEYPVQFDDATRAMRWVRAHANEKGIDPHKIGIMGFSAGGHLASTVGTHFDNGHSDSNDSIEHFSSRPDFMILCYPVISMVSEYTHQGSRRALLGDHPKPELMRFLSGELQVTPQTPPTFLFHTDEDNTVPSENSVYFYLALRKAKVPAEMHIYQQGSHGLGLAPGNPVYSTWKDRLKDWLIINHWAK